MRECWRHPDDAARGRSLLGVVTLLLGVAVLTALPALRNGHVGIAGFARVSATVVQSDGTAHDLCLLLAETAAQRRRGLMRVTDPALGGCDGMVFRFPRDTRAPFWMRDTPLPLSIAYFDSRGHLVSTTDMSPCGERADCPRYPPSAPYRYAVEVPQGQLPELGITAGSRLVPGSIRSQGSATARVTARETVTT